MITLREVAHWARLYLVWKTDLLFTRDDRFRLVDDDDTTKRGYFELSGITTGTTRTLTWPDASGTVGLIGDTVAVPIALDTYLDRNTKFSEQQLHGALLSLATGQPLNPTPTNIVVTKGTGKLLLVVNAGSDMVGDVTVTGTSVDRNTGAETASDTDTLTLVGVTTDNTDTDADGNNRYAMSDAYITSKWFTGSVTLSTTEVTLTDADVYHVSFEQFNDQPSLTLKSFDINVQPTNANATMYAYLYSLVVTGDTCVIAREASHVITSPTADVFYRKRAGNLGVSLDGSKDGVWIDLFLGPTNFTYFDDLTIKVWGTVDVALE